MALKQKTTIEIDVTRLDKSKFREFTRKDGSKAIVATIDVVEMEDQKVVLNKEGQPVKGNNSVLNNVGFAVQQQTKEERENSKYPILGDATRWVDDSSSAVEDVAPADVPW